MTISRTIRVDAPAPLLAALQRAFTNHKRATLKQYLKHRCIFVNGQAVTRHDYALAPGDEIRVEVDKKTRPDVTLASGLRIVYEDDAFMVVHKPPGMISVPDKVNRRDTALDEVNAYLAAVPGDRRGRAHVVHRLDRHTSGLLLFARTAQARAHFLDHWREVEKRYLAVIEGSLEEESGVIRSHLAEDAAMKVRVVAEGEASRLAITRFRVVKSNGRYSLVECVLETGRKNQIRVHLAGLGHPVVGDLKYGSKKNPSGRLALHAWRLSLRHPVTGKPLDCESPFPESLARLLETESEKGPQQKDRRTGRA